MSAWVRLGAKCVCIGVPKQSAFTRGARGRLALVIGGIYTVNDVLADGFIGLEEIDQAVCISSEYFRPVVPPKAAEDDVALFRHHLNTVEEPA